MSAPQKTMAELAADYGLAQGKGVLQWTKNGAPTDRYEGEMKDGLYEGQGKLTYANKARYEGEFKAGERDGKGTYVFPSGARLTTEFREGRPQGHGMYVWSNGNRYIGEDGDAQAHRQPQGSAGKTQGA